MGRRDREEKPDRYAWRGDADSFDTDMFGPGHVPETTRESPREERLYNSYTWDGRESNAWERLPGRRDDNE